MFCLSVVIKWVRKCGGDESGAANSELAVTVIIGECLPRVFRSSVDFLVAAPTLLGWAVPPPL